MPRILIVPGCQDSGPGHWQSLWVERLPGVVRLASTNDSYGSVRLAGAYARAWGSEFAHLQNAGLREIEITKVPV